MLDLYIGSVIFSWFINRLNAYRTSNQITKEGYRYNKDPRSIGEKAESNFSLACKILIPGYNIFHALKTLFNPKAAMAERKDYLLRTNRITKDSPRPQMVLTKDGSVKTKEQILRELKEANMAQRRAELDRQKRIETNKTRVNTYENTKTYRK